jgi:NAD(P)-dependent dehydrogenase (short-subunit alcohol dehydrogenase family)
LNRKISMQQETGVKGRLQGKVAIITGATGGIGEATAKHFLHEGASVMLVARSNEKLVAVRGRLGSDTRLTHFVAEASDEEATAAAVAATVETFGGVDVLFANAGTEGASKPLEAQTLADFEQVLRTNVLGVWLAMKHCIGPMKKRGGGSIVATASIVGVIAFPGIAPYVASKHAVCGLVKTASLELSASGIRVNAIAPGPVDNRMIRSIETQMSPENPEAVRESVTAIIPMKRYATNEEVARFVAFLASDETSYCTGGIHMIDGGFVAA